MVAHDLDELAGRLGVGEDVDTELDMPLELAAVVVGEPVALFEDLGGDAHLAHVVQAGGDPVDGAVGGRKSGRLGELAHHLGDRFAVALAEARLGVDGGSQHLETVAPGALVRFVGRQGRHHLAHVAVVEHAVAPAALGPQQRRVGRAQDGLGVEAADGEVGDADRRRHAKLVAGLHHDVAHLLADAFGQQAGVDGRCLGQQDGELLAAVAGHEVGFAGAVGEDRRHPAQDVVAPGVAEAVVDPLEVVEVHHQERERVAVAFAAPHLALEGVLEVTVVVEAGELVGDGAQLALLVERGVLDGDGGEVGERLDELELLLAVGLAAEPVECEHPDHLVHHMQGQHDGRLRFDRRVGHERGPGIGMSGVAQQRLVVGHSPAPETLFDADRVVHQLFGVLVAGEDRVDPARLPVDLADRQGVVFDEQTELAR